MSEKRQVNPGVVPGPEPAVQNNQPGNATPNPSNQPDKRLELLYGLSEADRSAIMALPETVREPAIAALHNGRVGYEEAMRTDLEAGRAAQSQVAGLLDNPEFGQFIRGELVPQGAAQVAPQAAPLATPSNGRNLVDEYGEPAAKYLDDIAERVVAKIGGDIGNLNTAINDLQRGFGQSQFEKDWGALTERTTQAGLPAPSSVESQIKMLMTRNPGLTIDQAYNASVDAASLVTRPATVTPAVTPVPVVPVVDPNIPTQIPGANAGQVGPKTFVPNADPEKAAIEARQNGSNLSVKEGVAAAFQKALDDKNTRDGTNLTLDDL